MLFFDRRRRPIALPLEERPPRKRRPPHGQRCFYAFCAIALVYIFITLIILQITKNHPSSELLENTQWIATSRYWADREMCGWFGVCGLFHMVNTRGWVWEHEKKPEEGKRPDYSKFWVSNEEDPDSWSEEERVLREIPQYVLDHAPYVHLYSKEEFWPSDLAEHLEHTTMAVNWTLREELKHEVNLTNLRDLNDYMKLGNHGRYMYLSSDDNEEEYPPWLTSIHNIPRLPSKNSDEDELERPSPHGNNEHDLQQILHQQAMNAELNITGQAVYEKPTDSERIPSTDGRCGGNSGFTCSGSGFGECCSIYGWCGASQAYCGDPCDPLSGKCYSPSTMPHGPKIDLRKRGVSGNDPASPKLDLAGRSSAPAFLVVVDKGDGVVDAFWFFFYSFNLGLLVFDIRFGNHLGDWEHTTVRFVNGTPTQIFMSEHEFGDAYTFSAVEKYIPAADGTGTMIGTWSNATAGAFAKRPVVYSAIGSHAMYGTPGSHPYILPFGLLHDETDRGPLWDPSLNVQAYTYDPINETLRASLLTPRSPTGWFDFAGHWGEKYPVLSDPRQYRLAGQYHYVNGPLGPKFKNLGRDKICQNSNKPCNIKNALVGDWRPRTMLQDDDEGEIGGLPGGNHTDDRRGRRRRDVKIDLR